MEDYHELYIRVLFGSSFILLLRAVRNLFWDFNIKNSTNFPLVQRLRYALFVMRLVRYNSHTATSREYAFK